MSIVVRNLSKVYGEQKAVENISFTIGTGEIVGFLGPNGAGKSTTMKMITGYLDPTAGEISVNGTDVRKDPLAAKKKVGYLPESNALYYDMYVREYLGFIADIHQVKNRKQRIEEVIRMTGLSPESHKTLGQLSKGYKQRAGLAAALVHDPEVLILDEPTSGLDPNQIIEIRNVIRDQGKTKLVLFSSHILQEVEAICNRIIIINKGHIVADDSLKNLQSRSGRNLVKVRFQEKADRQWFEGINGILAINESGDHSWSIETNDPETLRKQVLELALRHNLNIVSLQSENQSLEEVFRSLTVHTPSPEQN